MYRNHFSQSRKRLNSSWMVVGREGEAMIPAEIPEEEIHNKGLGATETHLEKIKSTEIQCNSEISELPLWLRWRWTEYGCFSLSFSFLFPTKFKSRSRIWLLRGVTRNLECPRKSWLSWRAALSHGDNDRKGLEASNSSSELRGKKSGTVNSARQVRQQNPTVRGEWHYLSSDLGHFRSDVKESGRNWHIIFRRDGV